MIFFTVFLLVLLSINPYLNDLVETARGNRRVDTDSVWSQYMSSLKKDKSFSEHTSQLGGLENIKEYEIRFSEGKMTEAEFCQQIGLAFSKEAMPAESEFFLNKAEALGAVDAKTYLARAANYDREWNTYLHYNEDLSDPELKKIEEKWRENLVKFINTSTDSTEIYEALLELTNIYDPARTSLFTDSLAPGVIANLEKFTKMYTGNPSIEKAYEILVWWLYRAKRWAKLRIICQGFLKKYPNSKIIEYIKFQLGNAYYFLQNYSAAKKVYLSVKQDLIPFSVYPGWGGQYIRDNLNCTIFELKDKKW